MSDDKGSDRQRFQVGDRVQIIASRRKGAVGTVTFCGAVCKLYCVQLDGSQDELAFCDFEMSPAQMSEMSVLDEKRMCRFGDTVSTTWPGEDLHCQILAQDVCDYAKLLVASGRWRVSRCGRCGLLVEECACDIAEP